MCSGGGVMPALNFQKQFAPSVEQGDKKQTIRAARKRPFKEGDTLYLYTGMRTKSCRKLGEAIAVNVFDISISSWRVMIDKTYLKPSEVRLLAIADGFKSAQEFYDFFNTHDDSIFHGQLIKWVAPIGRVY